MAELLIEFRSEEIPARMQRRAAMELERLLTAALMENNLKHGPIALRATPRRLAICVDSLPDMQPSRTVERKGPRTDAPEEALEGFVRSTRVSLEECKVCDDKKGSFYMAVWEEAGRPTRDVLSEIVVALAADLPWPKSMRWADTRFRWVRPLHAVLAIFDGVPLEGGLETGGGVLAFTDQTVGHRFHAPDNFAVGGLADYDTKLRNAFVIADSQQREDVIREQMALACADGGFQFPDDDGLYAEVAGLVEWPRVLIGAIDPSFMDLPAEVLISSMREHQKYFGLTDGAGELASSFAFVSNIEADDPAAVIAGNERVLRARLSDAKYFWDHDLETPLAEMQDALSEIVFHAKLGSVGDKVARIEGLAGWFGAAIPGVDAASVIRAARLAKADLVSGMVGEFPDLQGVIGRYYAVAQGEPVDVANAIADHYAPQGPSDVCPSAPMSMAVALADKVDTLVGFWLADEKPTSSKDPFALRRAALGVIRILLENGLRISLRDAFAEARRLHECTDEAIDADLLSFFADRLKVYLRDHGVRHDHIEAVIGLQSAGDLVEVVARVHALDAFLGTDDGTNLLVAYRRASNILRSEEKQDDVAYNGDQYKPGLDGTDDVEAVLWKVLSRTEAEIATALTVELFETAMQGLAELRQPVDEFFEQVTVNADDPSIRGNRLRLLARIQGVMNDVADFSKIEG
ncbi:MAG: glycine--tRNA ligase subunit beta [Alphaproteobacteria bacterium]|nr:glycine--tRNA ligase subunit beta [Alphaproteobacteria bacterium]